MDDESKDILIRIYREAYERSKFEIETQKQKIEELEKLINRLRNQLVIKTQDFNRLEYALNTQEKVYVYNDSDSDSD
jgi:Lon protease-like protein